MRARDMADADPDSAGAGAGEVRWAADRPPRPPRSSRRIRLAALVVLVSALAAWAGSASRPGRVEPDPRPRAAAPTPTPTRPAAEAPARYLWIGLREPPARPAAESRLRDDEPVVGVLAGGKARAYRLKALARPASHIVNDLIAGVPVTVTYCDLTDCLKGFTAETRGSSLDVRQGGLGRDEMMLLWVGGVLYRQESGLPEGPGTHPAPFPLQDYPVERTTWKAWRLAHPDTDVVGG